MSDFNEYLSKKAEQCAEAELLLSERGVPRRDKEGNTLNLVQRLTMFLELVDKKLKPQ